jgi:cell division protease FtsH
MKISYVFIINIITVSQSFIRNKCFNLRSVLLNSNNNEPYINKNLLDVDNRLEKLYDEMKELKKEKYKIIGNNRGLKMNDPNKNESLSIEDDDDEYNIPPNIKVIFRNQQIPHFPQRKQDLDISSDNFQIIKNNSMNFTCIGGYDLVKEELMQCADMLVNFEKYKKYNVRTPKGLILEGPPGNGKTLLAKCYSGEINVSFIPVSGAQFQEKYVGVGASRVRELFTLATENKPCIIFIDEIDAIGRKRTTDDKNPNSERDSTLNELLVCLDGFKTTEGIFVMGATNRLDLLDTALTRPGRIDKSIFIGLPDAKTRESIIKIHIDGKPHDSTINIENLIEMTQGLSGAQIENLLNEGMLLALRSNKEIMTKNELEYILNRILVGWQASQHVYTDKLLYQIAVHEMGHAIVGLLSKDYNKLLKVSLNLWSPKTPGYTLFETKDNDNLFTKQKLITHLMVLLGGRIAEEEFFNEAISTGASKDLEDAKVLAQNMILTFGMGSKLIYPYASDRSKEIVDEEITELIEIAYRKAKIIILNSKKLIEECANILTTEHILTPEFIEKKINSKYMHLKFLDS